MPCYLVYRSHGSHDLRRFRGRLTCQADGAPPVIGQHTLGPKPFRQLTRQPFDRLSLAQNHGVREKPHTVAGLRPLRVSIGTPGGLPLTPYS